MRAQTPVQGRPGSIGPHHLHKYLWKDRGHDGVEHDLCPGIPASGKRDGYGMGHLSPKEESELRNLLLSCTTYTFSVSVPAAEVDSFKSLSSSLTQGKAFPLLWKYCLDCVS